ncbi:hypothetical protein M408DRAFT_325483 [Serendipita vermifera MAFF 305830]|uniref:Uncharacterized protein n=1 Tax=Serendipita vermifera MAFF 305830 TaxID=933852 RepID=A0A0C2XYH5_SERVB|nr:hypothetical protein M408DRAFT_325483 [Serendipita vermifera MAFF 305830]
MIDECDSLRQTVTAHGINQAIPIECCIIYSQSHDCLIVESGMENDSFQIDQSSSVNAQLPRSMHVASLPNNRGF